MKRGSGAWEWNQGMDPTYFFSRKNEVDTEQIKHMGHVEKAPGGSKMRSINTSKASLS